MADQERTEGWGVIRPGDRRAHYYRDGFSLCRRVGFYNGPLEPDEHPSPDDHKECRTALDREKAKAAKNVGPARYGEPVTEHSTPREPAWMTDPDRDDGEIQRAGDDGEEP